jgi:hypothetical protein
VGIVTGRVVTVEQARSAPCYELSATLLSPSARAAVTFRPQRRRPVPIQRLVTLWPRRQRPDGVRGGAHGAARASGGRLRPSRQSVSNWRKGSPRALGESVPWPVFREGGRLVGMSCHRALPLGRGSTMLTLHYCSPHGCRIVGSSWCLGSVMDTRASCLHGTGVFQAGPAVSAVVASWPAWRTVNAMKIWEKPGTARRSPPRTGSGRSAGPGRTPGRTPTPRTPTAPAGAPRANAVSRRRA